MAFQISPGINITEIDRTGVVNQIVSQTTAAYVGNYKWGPVDQIVTITTENDLVAKYGGPDETKYKDFFAAANYLAYGAPLQLIRGGSAGSKIANVGGGGIGATWMWNDENYDLLTNYGISAAATVKDAGLTGVLSARFAGAFGNSLKVSFSDNVERSIAFTALAAGAGVNGITKSGLSVVVGLTASGISGASSGAFGPGAVISVGDFLKFGTPSLQFPVTAVSEVLNSGATFFAVTLLTTNGTAAAEELVGKVAATVVWQYARYLDYNPTTSNAASAKGYINDEVAFAVVDEDGLFTNNPGQVLDVYIGSKAGNGTLKDGTQNFYPLIVNNSGYARWISHPATAQLTATGSTAINGSTALRAWGSNFAALGSTASSHYPSFQTLTKNFYYSLNGGTDVDATDTDITRGYALFENTESTESNLLIQGGHNTDIAKYLIDLADRRKDAIALVSPEETDVVNVAPNQAYENVIDFKRSLNKDTSYAILDSGWKYMYDKYYDTYRWMPLNPDIAGLLARTDAATNPWFSPAGYNRGILRNVVKLAFNPSKNLRDGLYTNNVNPVITQSGVGTLLFGDKTLLSKPSAFDRINVRRLFINLEKVVATAAKFQLFEFNDEFTRAQFIGLVEPFLRSVQAQRGITDYKIVCDETNNTTEVIENNQFVADIFIRPQRTINYIQLNFIAVRSNVDFTEVGANVSIL